MISLAGKCALITGGSRGVGAAIAMMLAESGANIAIGYRERAGEADKVVRDLERLGVMASAHRADIASPEGAEELFELALAAMGKLDIFVGNAGVWPPAEVSLAELSVSRWRGTMSANLDSVFYTSRLAVKAMVGGGRIVLVSSTAGQRGEAMHADYAASKGAIISLVKSLAVEVARDNITVNCVAPGWIDTEMVDSVRKGGSLAHVATAIPIGRVASARDVAGPILFLCSDLARHVTGEVLNVNGGSVLCG